MECNGEFDKNSLGELEGAKIELSQERMGDEKLDAMTTGIS